MNERVKEILEPLMKYEEWLEANHEGFAEARKGYDEAQKNQMNAPTMKQANRWQEIRLAYADTLAQIREGMREEYEKRSR